MVTVMGVECKNWGIQGPKSARAGECTCQEEHVHGSAIFGKCTCRAVHLPGSEGAWKCKGQGVLVQGSVKVGCTRAGEFEWREYKWRGGQIPGNERAAKCTYRMVHGPGSGKAAEGERECKCRECTCQGVHVLGSARDGKWTY